ncbi:MAG: BrnT family toxin [Treponema sp.]|jgi:uncharacterized DUF497 family protein|nr:BrnT family toxin [Treponema sp.]
MKFLWDEKKNLDNIKKHGLSFIQALPAFSDSLRKEYYDDKHSGFGEERFLLAGFAENSVLLISFTEPEIETVRIISARRATNHETEVLYNGNG